MNRHARLLRTSAFLALVGLCLLSAAMAQNYTFTTLAGLPEAGAGQYDGTNNAARFYYPLSVAMDGSSNVYVGDSYNHTIRKITPAGVVSTLAGLAGSSGTNDGTGSAARFNQPASVAVDSNGTVFVADFYNHTIRKITALGVVTTFVGLGGSSGTNDGTGGTARFNFPYGVALDSGGNVLVTDAANHTLRKVTPAGAVTTLAGLAGSSGTNDGTGNAARFYNPSSVTVQSTGNIFVADTYNHTIRIVSSAGVVTTLAGLAGSSGTNDDTGSAARFYYPSGVAVDTSGNVLVADSGNYVIRKVTSAGVVTTLAGLAGSAGSNDGTGSAARFSYLGGTALDSGGNVFVADTYNHTIRKITPTGVVTTPAGLASGWGSADGTGSAARFNLPFGVAVDSSNNVYVADDYNQTIRKITPAAVVTTLAGLAGSLGNNNGIGSAARFRYPQSVAVYRSTNVYVADTYNHTIRKVTTAGEVTNLAGAAVDTSGDGWPDGGYADGTGGAARFFNPQGVAVDTNGNVYVADSENHTIRKVTPMGVVTTLAGLTNSPGSNDGVGSAARFNKPSRVAVDGATNVYVADTYNHTIRKITPAGAVTTLAGLGGSPGSVDGTGSEAGFYHPVGVAVDGIGNVYVADFGNHTIRKVTSTGVVTTLAGGPGILGTADGTGSAARFYYPCGPALDSAGTLYVADSYNNTIRKGYPALPDRPIIDLPAGEVGVVRQLDVTNLTTTSWSWRIIRRPATSSAQLSSATARNPTFTPDAADLYILRFQGQDNQGRVAIGTVEIIANADATPPTLSITSPTWGQWVTNALVNVIGAAADNAQVTMVWYQLNTNSWQMAAGTTNWLATLGVPAGTNTVHAYAVDVSGNRSLTNSVSFVSSNSFQLQLGFGSAQPLTNGAFELRLDASLGMTGRIEASTNLSNWIWLTNFVSTNSPIYFQDPAATNYKRRFYRALVP